ncbi:MAG: DUF3788 family protein, partial [Planctomycetales bacterium]|nr:DUF3788 family protein [Planctomycetales bacterium]
MDEPILGNPDEYPSDAVLRRHLGRAMASWQALMKLIDEHDPALTGEWRYYKDGKRWLYKANHKKLTVCWATIYPRGFKTTCYFPDRAEKAIVDSALPKTYVDQYLRGPHFGKTRAITVDVRKL